MRITRDDPRFTYAQVTLDGVNLEACVAADSAQGWADVLVDDNKTYVRAVGDGNVKVEDGGFQIERRYGVVSIIVSPDYPGAVHIPPRTAELFRHMEETLGAEIGWAKGAFVPFTARATPLPLANEMDASEG